jgi:hypothetical protein
VGIFFLALLRVSTSSLSGIVEHMQAHELQQHIISRSFSYRHHVPKSRITGFCPEVEWRSHACRTFKKNRSWTAGFALEGAHNTYRTELTNKEPNPRGRPARCGMRIRHRCPTKKILPCFRIEHLKEHRYA